MQSIEKKTLEYYCHVTDFYLQLIGNNLNKIRVFFCLREI